MEQEEYKKNLQTTRKNSRSTIWNIKNILRYKQTTNIRKRKNKNLPINNSNNIQLKKNIKQNKEHNKRHK